MLKINNKLFIITVYLHRRLGDLAVIIGNIKLMLKINNKLFIITVYLHRRLRDLAVIIGNINVIIILL